MDDRSNVYDVVATRLDGQLQQQPQMQLKAKWKSSAPRFRSFSTVNAHLLVGREQQHVDWIKRGEDMVRWMMVREDIFKLMNGQKQ